jgi:ribosome-binding factor A
MHRYDRADRVAHLIQREVSHIITYEVKDNRIAMVSVTGVEVSRDFKTARIFVSVLGERGKIDAALEALDSSARFIRSRLRERIMLKHIPTLTFLYDSSIANGIRIDTLLNEFKKHET